MAAMPYDGPKEGETSMPQPKVPTHDTVHHTLALFNPPKAKAVLVRVVNKISTKKKAQQRVLVVFMNRLLMCRETGQVSRAVHAAEVDVLSYCQTGSVVRFMLGFKDKNELSMVWEPVQHPANPKESPWKVAEAINNVRGRFHPNPLPLKKFATVDAMWSRGNYSKSSYVTPKAKLTNPTYSKDPPPPPSAPSPQPVFSPPEGYTGDVPVTVTISRTDTTKSFGVDMKGMVVAGSIKSSPAEGIVEKFKGLSLVQVEGIPVNFISELPQIIQSKKDVKFTFGKRDFVNITRSLEEPLGITYTSTPEAGIKLTGVERHSPAYRGGGEGYVGCYISHVDEVVVGNERDLGRECNKKPSLTLRLSNLPLSERPSPVHDDIPKITQLADGGFTVEFTRRDVADPIGLDLQGVKIFGVQPGTLASRIPFNVASLTGQMITEANGNPISTRRELNDCISNHKNVTLKITPPKKIVESAPPPPSEPPEDVMKELSTQEPIPPPKGTNDPDTLFITKAEGEDTGVKLDRFKITGCEPGSPAERCGGRQYIERKVSHVGDTPIYTVREFAELTKNGGEVCIRFAPVTPVPSASSHSPPVVMKSLPDDYPLPPPSIPPSTIDGGYVESEAPRGEVQDVVERPIEVYDSGTGGAYGTVLHAVAQLVDRQARTEDLLCTLLGSLREQQQQTQLTYKNASPSAPYYLENRPSSPVFVRDEVLPVTDLTTEQGSQQVAAPRLYDSTSSRRRRLPSTESGVASPRPTITRSIRSHNPDSPSYRRVEIDLTAGKVVLT